MLLTGTFPRTIDDKQRLAIPKRIRDALADSGRASSLDSEHETSTAEASRPIPGGTPEGSAKEKAKQVKPPVAVYIAPGTDGSLAIYTEESFLRLAEQLAASPPTGQDVRAFSRLFYSQAERVEIDRQGRIRLSPELVALAGIRKEVVLVGVRDHLELWDKQRWDGYLQQQQSHYDQLAERAFDRP